VSRPLTPVERAVERATRPRLPWRERAYRVAVGVVVVAFVAMCIYYLVTERF
jgi:hypothetical protein